MAEDGLTLHQLQSHQRPLATLTGEYEGEFWFLATNDRRHQGCRIHLTISKPAKLILHMLRGFTDDRQQMRIVAAAGEGRKGLPGDRGIRFVEMQIWCGDTLISSEYAFDEAGNPSGTFQMPQVRLNRTYEQVPLFGGSLNPQDGTIRRCVKRFAVLIWIQESAFGQHDRRFRTQHDINTARNRHLGLSIPHTLAGQMQRRE